MTPADQLAHAAAVACDTVGSTLHAEPGWRTRGHGITPVTWRAAMWHDTVTGPDWSRAQLTRLLRDGRADLPGPIANVQLERSGDAVLIAAGRAYHAGPGRDPLGVGVQSGNLHTVGVEAANAGAGSGERWSPEQYRWAVVFTAALEVPALGHLEWTDRKQDPWAVDMNRARTDVTEEDTMTPEQEDRLVARIADQVTRDVWTHPVGRTGESHSYHVHRMRRDLAAVRALVEALTSRPEYDPETLAAQVASRVDIDLDELADRLGHRATAVEVADELARRLAGDP